MSSARKMMIFGLTAEAWMPVRRKEPTRAGRRKRSMGGKWWGEGMGLASREAAGRMGAGRNEDNSNW
jgi:hypothetical protein